MRLVSRALDHIPILPTAVRLFEITVVNMSRNGEVTQHENVPDEWLLQVTR
jgi:hypothetical protein